MDPLWAMIREGSNTDYDLGIEYYIENFLKNSLEFPNKNQKYYGVEKSSGVLVDRKTLYRLNNFGYRDEDWHGYAEILAVGCSNTYGVGVPENGSWPKILQSITGKGVRNLSRPGISIQDLVFKIFAYCKEFGNPKTIVCLFPDFFRIALPTNSNLIYSPEEILDGTFCSIHLSGHEYQLMSNRPKYSKKPHNYKDIIPLEVPLFFSIKSIHMLEQYCSSNNIKLIWSTWYSGTHDVFEKLTDLPFSNFCLNKNFCVNYKIEQSCHDNYKEMFNEYFYNGLDIEEGTSMSHPGVHSHIHIAEAFYKEINK